MGAEARLLAGTHVKAGVERILDSLAIDELDHDVRSTLTHFEWALADLGPCRADAALSGLVVASGGVHLVDGGPPDYGNL